MQTTGTFPQLTDNQRQTVAAPASMSKRKRPPLRPQPAPSPLTPALAQLTANALRRP